MNSNAKGFSKGTLFSKFKGINIKIKFLIVALIPIIILLGMTVLPLITLYNGTEVAILADAYHSSDTVRGKNLYLEYKISNITADKLPNSIKNLNKEAYNRPINAYAVLKKTGDIYDLDYISLEKPKAGLYLKCQVMPIYEEQGLNLNKDSIYITYTLDRFFISESISKNQYMESSKYNGDKWMYVAKIKIYNGYAILTDVQQK